VKVRSESPQRQLQHGRIVRGRCLLGGMDQRGSDETPTMALRGGGGLGMGGGTITKGDTGTSGCRVYPRGLPMRVWITIGKVRDMTERLNHSSRFRSIETGEVSQGGRGKRNDC